MWLPLSAHSSVSASSTLATYRDALTSGRVPTRALYESWSQSARWLSYHRATSPAVTDADVVGTYDQAFRAVQASSHPRLEVVSLGSGGGNKDQRLLKMLGPRSHIYRPIEVSTSLAFESHRAASPFVKQVDARLVDLEADLSADAFGPREAARLWLVFGLTPSFDLIAFGRRLQAWLQPGDLALISFNLSPGPMPEAKDLILPQYANDHARAWLMGALIELGIRDDDVQVATFAASDDPAGEVWHVRVQARFRRDVPLRLPDGEIDFARDHELAVFRSNRLTARAATAWMTSLGLEVVSEFLAEGRQEGVYFAVHNADGG
ncbi:MAG: L-histidine N(alpha)-methyltransferase [Myxococcales bacterium]|nr:L-histidine N(alpha)-methyltransferase [Myxococcales bacterium]